MAVRAVSPGRSKLWFTAPRPAFRGGATRANRKISPAYGGYKRFKRCFHALRQVARIKRLLKRRRTRQFLRRREGQNWFSRPAQCMH
jgi:hypothetical protein